MPLPHRVFARILEREQPDTTFHQEGSSIRSSDGQRYFAKIGSASDRDQYIGEAESLKAMYSAAPGLVPQLIDCGIIDTNSKERDSDVGRPYFLSEYKDIGTLTTAAAKTLGKRLATELHAYKSPNGFGFHIPTYCGRTRQENGWFQSWPECFDALMAGLEEKLRAQGGYESLCNQVKEVRER